MIRKVLPVLVFALFSFVACNQPKTTNQAVASKNVGKIAYVNIDSLMAKYQLAKDLNEEFTQKQENMTADLNVKAKKVEDMIKSFQYRLQNNGFATRERAEKEQARIEKKRQELAKLNQSMQEELAAEYQKVVNRLQDTITKSLEMYNKDLGFDLILRTTKAGNVLYGNPNLDITAAFLKQLNASYTPSKKKN